MKSRQNEVRKLLESLEDSDQRISVAHALARSNPNLAVTTLSRALKLDNPVLRLRALEMIEIIGRAEPTRNASLELLIHIAMNDYDWAVRRQSTVALGNFNSEQAIPTLIQKLGDDDPRVHEAEIAALIKQETKVLSYLQFELRNSNPLLLKWRCIELFKILGIPDIPILQLLIPYVNDDESIIRDEARAALESFRPYFYEDLQRVTALFETLSLNEFGEENVKLFLEILVDDKDAFKQALKEFAKCANKDATSQFVALLNRYHLS